MVVRLKTINKIQIPLLSNSSPSPSSLRFRFLPLVFFLLPFRGRIYSFHPAHTHCLEAVLARSPPRSYCKTISASVDRLSSFDFTLPIFYFAFYFLL